MPRYAMVVDLDRCMGCRACMEACKVENNTPQGSFWMYVFRFEEGAFPHVRTWFLPRPCMHCDNAPCVKVCPVGARYKRTDGLVATDYDRCIGCRYCEVACPYGVNTFNWKRPDQNYYLDWADREAAAVLAQATDGAVPPYRNPDLDRAWGPEQRRTAGGGRLRGVVEKCTFCVHRIERGLLPACVANCPALALHFGDLDDPSSTVSRLLAQRPHFQLLEDAGTEPRVYYLGQKPPGADARQVEAVKARV
ncbi:MAG: 4Fe-4S dicluster domain-containing protein [Armatimonadota bacterium]|nr:4Fe-4S dicluster domain-containing protein [Armatimonadota bacterium]MDR7486323.1 4Fe-4S dicluster domain-containing protein [Armatimonadota bacterium]MDR7532298.1 4Fe-4S dicluster domain-containing protein [Armatimonadota bacterium]MDR7537229.1 4Fe-4S dicluster domain-containing protein [Armatimonadota bacterium]